MKERWGSVPQASPRTPSLCGLLLLGGHLWSQEPWCPSGEQAEGSGAGGEKRRGLSGRMSPGNVLWEEKQNFLLNLWPQFKLGERGRRPGQVFSRRLLSSCSLLVVQPRAGPSGLLAGSLMGVLQFRGPPAERLPNLQVAALRRRRRRRRTRPARRRSRSCCTVPASVSGSTCAWGSASCP